jgi:hypothetical protein
MASISDHYNNLKLNRQPHLAFLFVLILFLELLYHRETHFKCLFRMCVYAGPNINVLRVHLRNNRAGIFT